MSILNLLRRRSSPDGAAAGAMEADRADPGQPIPGYDRIANKHLIAELSKHSQAELAAIESYEGSHKNRKPVFQKLHYLRGPEPLEGYDELSVEEILVGLEGAGKQQLQKTRLYERKFQRRPDVLEKIADALHADLPRSRRDAPPATPAS